MFDYGGVLWNMRWDVAHELEAKHGLAPGSLHDTLYECDAWRELQCGRGDRDAWLSTAHVALETAAGRPLPPLHAEWREREEPIASTIALIRALKPTYRVSVLSNADYTLRERLGTVMGILGLFDDVVCSAEVGYAKPDPEIYALACRRLRLPPAACVFVDDYDRNIEAAIAAGLRGVLYRVDRGDDLRALLTAAGVEIT